VWYYIQESSAVAETPARRDSIPNSSRRNPWKWTFSACITVTYSL